MGRRFAFVLIGVLSACSIAPRSDDSGGEADTDLDLCDALNTYRADRGLPPIPVSAALMTVARYHAEDLAANGTGGASCNLHSWTSDDPRWSGCCYTDDNAQAECMWNKPREIASYPSPGVEIAARHGTRITPSTAVAAWAASERHRIVIANDADFAGATWRAMGCAIEAGIATAWFGELAAP
ncbi:MAG: CAP domain-containing protein [Kofleriaceae bacterium]|nr:MAG: CAP domain-containing protein [Kofleriaceae bacterium]